MIFKWIQLVLLWFLCVHFSFAQQEATLTIIKDQVEIIDNYTDSVIFSLEPEEFLDKAVDHGAELNGYYEHDRLKKVIRKVGLPTAMVITTFYFWNNQLISVNYEQHKYMMTKNDIGAVIMDYENAFIQYKSQHYFNQEIEIEKKTVGNPIKNIEPEELFVAYSKRMKKLLDNKFNNRNAYELLQGKWKNIHIPGDYIIFEETLRFNFSNNKFVKKFKVEIRDDVMFCASPKDEYIYRYKIESLSNSDMILQDLQNTSEDVFVYKKEE